MAEGGAQEPEAWFESPLLRVLDARGRADVRAAGTRRTLAPGAVAYGPGEAADTLWFVGRGSVTLSSGRGARRLGPREHFGSEALVRGAQRGSRASAEDEALVLEVPVSTLRRVLGRAGAEALLAREEAAARRQAFSLLIAETPLGQGLDGAALAALVAEGREERRQRGEPLFAADAPARAAFLVARGLVETGSSPQVAYAARGDWLGLDAALGAAPYGESATALGDVLVLSFPKSAVTSLAKRSPDALSRQGSRERARRAKQRRVHELARERGTRHAFHEVARLESARSLLAIDLESCTRCGHCAWACADAHGTARIERRGERAMLALPDADGALRSRAVLFPQACQHCKDPVCLVECPTGAIGREADGAVLLREDLCTGCGACAKACPWDAIRMAPRSGASAPGASATVATKCDLCRDGDGPECVSACPTNAIFRAEPERDFAELRGALGAVRGPGQAAAGGGGSASTPPRWHVLARLVMWGALLPPLVAIASSSGVAGRWRRETGILAALVCLLLLGHALPKRLRQVRAWLRRCVGARLERGLGPLVRLHSLLGVAGGALVLCHTGGRLPGGASGALALSFWLLAACGAFGAAAYRALPGRLSRLERRGALPEDHPAELEASSQRLYSALSDQSPARKALARRVLLPYAHAPFGPIALILSGRSLAEEEAAVAARIERLLGAERGARLASAGGLVGTSVALRALRARRLLERLLGAWLPLHQLVALIFALLLAVHVVAVLR